MLQKQVCKTVDLTLVSSLEPLAHRRNAVSLQSFLVDAHLNWLNWFHFLILLRGRLVIRKGCTIYQSPLYVNRFFRSTANFWNSFLAERLPLTLI